MSYTTFEEFCEKADSLTNLEKRTDNYSVREYRLDRMKALLLHIGNPQEKYKSIHIAGSKGKGSTAIFIANALRANGIKTALYMSPHLIDYRERFTLSGSFIEDTILVEVANVFTSKIQDFSFSDDIGPSHPTTFEIYTAYAFFLFSYINCEMAVIETGLGGRLDATNIITPILSIITPIELEHTAILGNTLEKIAVEKSKIIKQTIPVCISRQTSVVRQVLEKEAQEKASRLYDLMGEVESISAKTTQEREIVDISWVNGKATHLKLRMRGEVSGENSALALLALKVAGLYKEGISEKALEETTLVGRMQLINTTPPIIIDGAHTSESLRHLLNSINQLYKEEEKVVIFGALEDKDHIHMIRLLLPVFSHIIISRPGTFKKSNVEDLYNLFRKEIEHEKSDTSLYLEKEAPRALNLALNLSKGVNPIIVTGSFYLAGDILTSYNEMNEEQQEIVCP